MGAVMGEVLSQVESELLCRAYFHMYLGDSPLDKDAKEKFGQSLLSLFWENGKMGSSKQGSTPHHLGTKLITK